MNNKWNYIILPHPDLSIDERIASLPIDGRTVLIASIFEDRPILGTFRLSDKCWYRGNTDEIIDELDNDDEIDDIAIYAWTEIPKMPEIPEKLK